MKKTLVLLDYCLNGYCKWIEDIARMPTKDEMKGIEVVNFNKFMKGE